MQTFTTPSDHFLTTALGRIGADPSRLMTIREWWYEMDEPVAMLADPQATFREDERNMIEQCRRGGINIAYRNGERAAFPAWRLAMFYANP
jgi:hypothetical protein